MESSGLEIQKQRTSVGQMREETAERDRRISDFATKVTSMENAATGTSYTLCYITVSFYT